MTLAPLLDVRPLGALSGEWVFIHRIAHSTNAADTRAEVWAVPAAGGDAKLAVRYAAPRPMQSTELRRQLAADGRSLVLAARGASGGDNIVLVDLVQGTSRLLFEGGPGYTDDVPVYATPAIAPSGDRIALLRSLRGKTELFVATTASGGEIGPLAEAFVVYGWTPDGTGVAYGTWADGAYRVLDLANGQSSRVAGQVLYYEYAPASSRRASPSLAIATSATQRGGEQQIVVAAGPGAPEVTVARSDGAAFFKGARWRPTADEILYRAGFDVFVVDLTRPAPRKLRLAGPAVAAEWSVYGDEILYAVDDERHLERSNMVRTARLDGRGDRALFAPPQPNAGFGAIDGLLAVRY